MVKKTDLKKVKDSENHLQLGDGDYADSSHRAKKKKNRGNFENASDVVNVNPSQAAVAIEGCTEVVREKKKTKKKKKRLGANAGKNQFENGRRKDKGIEDDKTIVEANDAYTGNAGGEEGKGLQLNIGKNLASDNALKPSKEEKKKKRKHEEIEGKNLITSVPSSYEDADGNTQMAGGGNCNAKEGTSCVENQDGYKKKKKKKKKKRKKQEREEDCDSEIKKTIDAGDDNTEADGKIDNKEKKKNNNNKKEFNKGGLSDLSKDITPKEAHKRVSFSDHLEVFPLPDELGNDNNQSEGLVRGKRFTVEEDEIVRKAVLGYIDEHQLGEEGLQMVLNCRSYPEVRGCWKHIAAAIPWRHLDSVYHRAHILFEQDSKRMWTPEELDIVRKFHEKHGPKWKMLADALGKHRLHLKDAWRRIRMENKKAGQWSQEEYQALFDLVNTDLRLKVFQEKKTKHGMLRDNICWEAISDNLSTRTNTDCCNKWYKQLSSPMVVGGSWKDADDYHLIKALVDLDACCIEDVDWDNILEHRSGDLCLKRWNQMAKHLGVYGNKSFAEQVEILAKRYCPEMAEVRETVDNRPAVDADASQ